MNAVAAPSRKGVGGKEGGVESSGRSAAGRQAAAATSTAAGRRPTAACSSCLRRTERCIAPSSRSNPLRSPCQCHAAQRRRAHFPCLPAACSAATSIISEAHWLICTAFQGAKRDLQNGKRRVSPVCRSSPAQASTHKVARHRKRASTPAAARSGLTGGGSGCVPLAAVEQRHASGSRSSRAGNSDCSSPWCGPAPLS